MTTRRLWTIAVITALLLDTVLCWAMSFSRSHFSWSLLLAAVAARIAIALILGAFAGWLFRRMGRSLFASSFGMLACDVVWMEFITRIGAADAWDLLLNPLIVMVVLMAPISASADRPVVFRMGLCISVLVPLIIATWILISLQPSAGPAARGTGLAQALTVILTMVSMAVGVGGIIASRYIIYAVERFSKREATTDSSN